MTDISVQNCNLKNSSKSGKNSSHKNLPSREDFLIKKSSFNFKKYTLFDSGFLRGRQSKIRFFTNNISKDFKIRPAVDGKLFDGDISLEIDNLVNWERLYIEVFDEKKFGYSKRYLVTRKCSNRAYIYSYDEERIDKHSKNPNDDLKKIQLDILDNNDYIKKEYTSSYSFGYSHSVNICGDNISVALSPFNSSFGATLLWQITIFYILNDALVKSCEHVVGQFAKLNKDECYVKRIISNFGRFISTLVGRRTEYDKCYEFFMCLKMNHFRSNLIDTTTSLIADKIWNILCEHFKIKESVENLCSLVNSDQSYRNEKIIRYLTCLAALFGLLELFDKFRGSDASKSIVSIFMPCSF
jgi:hypothetical protein